ncbi:MAG: hypothetical protein ACREBW_00060, partial [Candidatus Micrarchaeaceae archaeon]
MSEMPYTPEQFLNAEQEMDQMLAQSAEKYKVNTNAMFAKLSDLANLSLDDLKRWSRANSLWPMQFGLACCAMELLDFGASRIDAERKGYLLFRGTPRQTDVM